MARRNIAKEIEAGLNGIVADLDGAGPKLKTRVIAVPDVRQIRQGLGLSQSQFSDRFGLNPRTVQEWEQKRRTPDQIAAALLTVIEAKPKIVEKVLRRTYGGLAALAVGMLSARKVKGTLPIAGRGKNSRAAAPARAARAAKRA